MTPTEQISDYPYSYADGGRASIQGEISRRIAPYRFGLAAQAIVKELQITANQKILELGSGLGLLGHEIKKCVPDVNYLGIDIMFESANKSRGLIRPIQANASNLPFGDNSFDNIITTDMLEHVQQPEKAILEMSRVLKKGGGVFAVIADPIEGRFSCVPDHIRRTQEASDVPYWEDMFRKCGFSLLPDISKKYRERDWRNVFNNPFLTNLKNRPGFACAFNPICRPGVYILKKQ